MKDAIIPHDSNSNYVKLQDWENLQEIKSFQSQLEKSRSEHLNTIRNFVTEIRIILGNLKTELVNTNATENIDAGYLKSKMIDMGVKIQDLKETVKEELSNLVLNENNLNKEVEYLHKRVEEWAKPVSAQIIKIPKQSIYKIQEANNCPLKQFQKFILTSGGHYGGWAEQDHFLFLRVRKKCKEKSKVISAVHEILPDMGYEDIEEHEKWYQKYEILKNSQKEAIQKWRAEKLLRKEPKTETTIEKKDLHSAKKAKLHRNIMERIQKWKNQQFLKKAEEEEKLKEQQQKHLLGEIQKFKESQRLKKMAVAQYKATKKSVRTDTEILNEEINRLQFLEKKAKNDILLKAFRLQDIEFVERKKLIRLRLETKSKEKYLKLKNPNPAMNLIIKRDPQRVLQPTLVWNQHCQQSVSKEKLNLTFDLNSIPHLAVPEWRRALK